MKLKSEYEERSGHLFIKVVGKWTTNSAKNLIDKVKAEADARGFSRVLLDITAITQPDSEMTRFYSGEYIAKIWRPPLRVAALAKPKMINKFAENVAVNRGAVFGVFSDAEEALGWLLEG
ncbi:hypothetical protein JW935_06680 [candidate division KSB1 bacterium]|nr:hypothetical protein [candidate division KSB1 bacterium]